MNLPQPYTVGELRAGPPCCDPQPHLSVRGLGVSHGGRSVLDDVSLDIHRGCVTALIGPSGCGKTSFLSALNRMTDLIPGARVRGQVLLGGQDVYAPGTDTRLLRQRVGSIFQRPNPFPLSIRRNLELPLREHGLRNRAELADRVERALRDAGLWDEVGDRLDAPALALSGGQQQRLCIARAIALGPEVLLMDEPCSALDPIASAAVEDLIARLRGQYTVVIVTHNLAQARRIANYAAFFWLRERVGKLIEFGRAQRLFEQPADALTAAYVGGLRG
ncbi:phosphate ABC transporter ATP-binding protein [Derxia lacustris]|uniref:phosphate ABC transporter ATP-binding protein n=1 Tax=Derxia lacustris TaxID=764842 RepID=UPI000A170045|nr:phosphate ABC transporter ATP-binding protein [Derxia lacustris]